MAGLTGGQHHAPGQRARHEAQAAGVLRHVARAPGGAARAQGETQLRVVAAGEGVELARARHLGAHVGEVGAGAHGVGEGLGLHHELGELDVVERARAIGQLHAGLQRAVALVRPGAFPFAALRVEALHRERLAADAARGRQGREHRVARDLVFQRQRRDDVDQRVQRGAGPALGQRGQRGLDEFGICRVVDPGLGKLTGYTGLIGLNRLGPVIGQRITEARFAALHQRIAHGPGSGLDALARRPALAHGARDALAGDPRVVGHHRREHEAADDGQSDLQAGHGA